MNSCQMESQNMNKLPCINCITYSICRSEYIHIISDQEELFLNLRTIAREHLEDKCQLLSEYINPSKLLALVDIRAIELENYMTQPLKPED